MRLFLVYIEVEAQAKKKVFVVTPNPPSAAVAVTVAIGLRSVYSVAFAPIKNHNLRRKGAERRLQEDRT